MRVATGGRTRLVVPVTLIDSRSNLAGGVICVAASRGALADLELDRRGEDSGSGQEQAGEDGETHGEAGGVVDELLGLWNRWKTIEMVLSRPSRGFISFLQANVDHQVTRAHLRLLSWMNAACPWETNHPKQGWFRGVISANLEHMSITPPRDSTSESLVRPQST